MKSRHTLPERLLSHALTAGAFEFRQHARELIGTPDLLFEEQGLAVFVHGCYWHRHLKCVTGIRQHRISLEWTRQFNSTVNRDQEVLRQLHLRGLRTFVAWECEILRDAELIARVIEAELAREAVSIRSPVR